MKVELFLLGWRIGSSHNCGSVSACTWSKQFPVIPNYGGLFVLKHDGRAGLGNDALVPGIRRYSS